MGRLADRVVLITQAPHFAGPAIAARLAAEGARVACFDESFADPAAAAAFSSQAPGATTFPAETSPQAMIARVEADLGALDVVISNDAHPARRMPLADHDPAIVRDAFEALVERPFALLAAAASGMKARGRGRMLLMTSAAPLRGLANYAPYAAARGAANALVLSLARELAASGITVNAVAPNFIRTPTYFPDELMADPVKRAKILSNIPVGRLGAAEEVAGLVAYLASDEGGFVTGRTVAIDGGWS